MLEELIEKCVEARSHLGELATEFALWRMSDGTWQAAIGGHPHVALGEWAGDIYSVADTAIGAVSDLLSKIIAEAV